MAWVPVSPWATLWTSPCCYSFPRSDFCCHKVRDGWHPFRSHTKWGISKPGAHRFWLLFLTLFLGESILRKHLLIPGVYRGCKHRGVHSAHVLARSAPSPGPRSGCPDVHCRSGLGSGLGEGASVHCQVLSGIPGLRPLGATAHPQPPV